MGINTSQKVQIIWILVGIPLISYFVLHNSFNLGLYGDDWQHLWNMWRDFDVLHTKSWFDIRSYLNPYWPEYFYLGIIRHFWEFYPPAYFYTSYLLRVFATISLFLFTLELTKRKITAILASFFFMISAAGLQTTDWVFNMNTYAGLGFLMLAFVFYLKIRTSKKFLDPLYLPFIVLFTLALGIVPTRMHSAAPVLVISDLLLTFFVEKQKFSITKERLLRWALPVLIFGLLIHFKSFGEGSYTSDRIADTIRIFNQYGQNGIHSLWFYFLGILGHIVIPDIFNLIPLSQAFQKISIFKSPYTNLSIVSFLFFTALGTILSCSLRKTSLKIYLPVLIFNIIWTILVRYLVVLDKQIPLEHLFSIFLGGQLIFLSLLIFKLSLKDYPRLSASVFIGLTFMIMMSFLYWVFTPYFIIETTGRYMTMGATGFAIIFASLVTLLLENTSALKKSPKAVLSRTLYLYFTIILVLLWSIWHIYTGQHYLNILNQTRNRFITEKAWGTIVREVPQLDPAGPSVFFFTTDNPLSLQGVLVFGFFPRAGMTYRIVDQDLTPLPCDNYKELLEFAKTGEPLKKVHGRPAVPVPLSRIYGFDFRNGELTNITNLVREQLQKDLQSSI